MFLVAMWNCRERKELDEGEAYLIVILNEFAWSSQAAA